MKAVEFSFLFVFLATTPCWMGIYGEAGVAGRMDGEDADDTPLDFMELAMPSAPEIEADLDAVEETELKGSGRRSGCQRRCEAEAPSDVLEIKQDAFCLKTCPDYVVPDAASLVDAECERCPNENCSRCRCDTGECLDDEAATGLADVEYTTSSVEDDDEDEALGYVGDYDIESQAAAIAATTVVTGIDSTSVDKLFCSRCVPRNTCRRLWYCKKKKTTRAPNSSQRVF